MEISILQIDAFTSQAFKGNPAAVCLLDEPRPAEWMQNVATEMNLSETAFVVPRLDVGFDLRWFTPAIEVPLCGHATLASAHALWETGRLARDKEARFHTLSGWLTANRNDDGIEMDFPALFADRADLPTSVKDALDIEPLAVVVNHRSDGSVGKYLVEIESESAVRNVKPDFEKLRRAVNAGVIITATGESRRDSTYDFVSRYFACYAGIDEDPVTGAAHCMLTPYWAAKLSKTAMLAYQASARGGELRVRLNGDRVILGGNAVTVLRGSLLC
ncbi:MAG TPA: PhzF family phenazine biosynthesis protein [Blastocatellia bacterium]|nr:PhzF family phenazine biosynthesis protein [Blastocatellia bacterium]